MLPTILHEEAGNIICIIIWWSRGFCPQYYMEKQAILYVLLHVEVGDIANNITWSSRQYYLYYYMVK